MSDRRTARAFLECTGACTDTRQLLENGMFFALKGPHFNANAFAAEALGNEAAAMPWSTIPKLPMDERYSLVPDVLRALQDARPVTIADSSPSR